MLDYISSIASVADKNLEKQVVNRLNDLTKPQGSLGRLEEFVLRYCLCRGSAQVAIHNMALLTFAGDHGITAENITPYPSDVTAQMVLNMAHGGAAVSVMCAKAGIEYAVVDIGVKTGFADMPGLIKRKVRSGTDNFLRQAAMTADECEKAIRTGYELGAGSPADLMGAGEMGIGNTSCASALYSLLLDMDTETTVGPGTGSAGALLEKKKAVIAQAVSMHSKEWDGSAFDALRRVGGLEIAGIAGLIFGCASRRIPVVVDGFIASSAACVAIRMNPHVKDYIFFSHVSYETFHAAYLQNEGIRPILSLDMRLGEGTGAVLAMQIIAQAMECYTKMATFGSAGVAGKIE